MKKALLICLDGKTQLSVLVPDQNIYPQFVGYGGLVFEYIQMAGEVKIYREIYVAACGDLVPFPPSLSQSHNSDKS